MTLDEFADAMKPHIRRFLEVVAEHLPRIEAAIQQAAEEFTADVETWLAAETARHEARTAPQSDSGGLDDRLHTRDDGEGA